MDHPFVSKAGLALMIRSMASRCFWYICKANASMLSLVLMTCLPRVLAYCSRNLAMPELIVEPLVSKVRLMRPAITSYPSGTYGSLVSDSVSIPSGVRKIGNRVRPWYSCSTVVRYRLS